MKYLEHMRPRALSFRMRKAAAAALWAMCVMCACAVALGPAAAMANGSAQLWVQSSMLSLDEAADRVQGAFGGRVVAAQPARAGGREGFRVRVLLDDGRVITVFVDADSGAMRPMG